MNRDTHDKVLDYLYDELPASEREAFEQQLRRDPALEREVESLRGVRQLVARATVPAPPAALLQNLQREARLAAPTARESWFDRFMAGLMRPATGVAFAALAIVGTGIYLSKQKPPVAARSPVGDVALLTDADKREKDEVSSLHETTIEPGDLPPAAAVPLPSPVALPEAPAEGFGGAAAAAQDATRAQGLVEVHVPAQTGKLGLAGAAAEAAPASPTAAPMGGTGELRSETMAAADAPAAAEGAAAAPTYWRAPVEAKPVAAKEVADGLVAGRARGLGVEDEASDKRVVSKKVAPLDVIPVALGDRERNTEPAAPAPQREVNTATLDNHASGYAVAPPEPPAELKAALEQRDSKAAPQPVYEDAPAAELAESERAQGEDVDQQAQRPEAAKQAPRPPAVVQSTRPQPTVALEPSVAAAPPPTPQGQARFGRRAEQVAPNADDAKVADGDAFDSGLAGGPMRPDTGAESETRAAQRADRAVDALRKIAAEEAQKRPDATSKDEAELGRSAPGSGAGAPGPDGQRDRARSLSGAGQLEQAASEYAALIERYPGYAYRGSVLIDWASVELRLGRLEAARALLRRAIAEPAIAATAKARLAEVEAQLAARAAADANRKAAEAGKAGNSQEQPAAPAEKTVESKPASSGAAPAKPATPKQKVAAPRRTATQEQDDAAEPAEPVAPSKQL